MNKDRMIDVSKFRIGNYVISRGEITKIIGIRTDTDDPTYLCENCDIWMPVIEGIRLNLEILQYNRFGMSDDKSYGILRTTFTPFGEHGVKEFEDYIIIDLKMPQSCLVKHQYLQYHEGFKPSLICRKYDGEIIYFHELQNIMSVCENKVEIKIDPNMKIQQ